MTSLIKTIKFMSIFYPTVASNSLIAHVVFTFDFEEALLFHLQIVLVLHLFTSHTFIFLSNLIGYYLKYNTK